MRWRENREAKARKLARRKWEARARVSLILRGKEPRRGRRVKGLRLRKVQGKYLGLPRVRLNTRWGSYTELQSTARRKRQMENRL